MSKTASPSWRAPCRRGCGRAAGCPRGAGRSLSSTAGSFSSAGFILSRSRSRTQCGEFTHADRSRHTCAEAHRCKAGAVGRSSDPGSSVISFHWRHPAHHPRQRKMAVNIVGVPIVHPGSLATSPRHARVQAVDRASADPPDTGPAWCLRRAYGGLRSASRAAGQLLAERHHGCHVAWSLWAKS